MIGLSSFLVIDYYRAKANFMDVLCIPLPGKNDKPSKKEEAEAEAAEESSAFARLLSRFRQYSSPITTLVVDYYSPLLQNYVVKLVVVIIFTIWLGICAWGCTLVEDGLNVEDVIPEGTVEHDFASANARHFAVYSFQVATKDIDYADIEVQKNLLEMSERVSKARNVALAGGITAFWLRDMIQFYNNTQTFYKNYYCDQLHANLSNVLQLQALYLDLIQSLVLIHLGVGTLDDGEQLGGLIATCNDITKQLVIRDGDAAYIPPDRFYQYVVLWVSRHMIYYTGCV